MAKKEKSHILIFIAATLAIIIFGIIITQIIEKNKQASGDIRARATAENALELIGVVTSIDAVKNVIVVDDVQFLSNAEQTLGKWTLVPPINYNLESAMPGSAILFGVDAKTFSITNHTVTALRITKQ